MKTGDEFNREALKKVEEEKSSGRNGNADVARASSWALPDVP
jgi:hypothetical protein